VTTKRNFDPEHRIDMYQARCTNCGYVETEYGDFSGFDDVQYCIDTLEDSWFARYRYEPKPRPDCPNARIAHLEELLCPSCQKCEVCGAERVYPNEAERLVCAEHEDHDFAEVASQ
jgi:hypothetical protein